MTTPTTGGMDVSNAELLGRFEAYRFPEADEPYAVYIRHDEGGTTTQLRQLVGEGVVLTDAMSSAARNLLYGAKFLVDVDTGELHVLDDRTNEESLCGEYHRDDEPVEVAGPLDVYLDRVEKCEECLSL